MDVFVKTPSGEAIPLDLLGSDSIATVKAKVRDFRSSVANARKSSRGCDPLRSAGSDAVYLLIVGDEL
jgi:hypothetical protein|eukprot:COSAG02_NODE_3149_length_7284_cov_3.179262_3_plen_68_part_00